MRLLLDSHALLWFLAGDVALSKKARAAIESPANAKHVSLATAWEMAIKVSLGKLQLHVPYTDVFPGALEANGFRTLPLALVHFHQLLTLPFHHRDPFDRLIVAQAMVEGMTLISCDPMIGQYGVATLW